MTTVTSSWLDGLYGNPVADGTRAGSFLTWDGANWIESYSLAIPGGAARSIGIAPITSGRTDALTIHGQTTTVAGAEGGAIVIDTGTPGAGGNAGIMLFRRGGVDQLYLGTAQTRIHAPSGGTVTIKDGAGASMIDVGDNAKLGFFGAAVVARPALDPGGASLQDTINALILLGLFESSV